MRAPAAIATKANPAETVWKRILISFFKNDPSKYITGSSAKEMLPPQIVAAR
jgi:hypothetical protein